jgi:hypothetical protein
MLLETSLGVSKLFGLRLRFGLGVTGRHLPLSLTVKKGSKP